ncbi:MAG: tetratricopeptide repeat protein [Desulfovibrio sp.]|jgi:cytochrome c-type biogenesis protein CcmH/NrfG|nr:tetratricopeptide repeat protein [Desulfovibrio sp.]
MTPFPPAARGLAAVCLLLGLFAMFLTSFVVIKNGFEERFRLKTAATNSSRPGPEKTPAGRAAPADKPAFAARTDAPETAVAFMRRIRADPGDTEALIGLGEELMTAGEWTQAENFLRQAIRNRPEDKHPRQMLGVCLFRQNKPLEAAGVFEDLLRLQEDPVALYNLAVLYKHHLNLPERADGLLRRALKSPEADRDLLLRLQEELAAPPEER